MKFYQKTWFIVLMMICLPPLGWFLMFKFTDWSEKTKKVLSIPLGIYTIFFVIACVMAAVNPPATTTVTPPASISSSSEPAASSKPTESAAPIASSEPAASSEPTESTAPIASSEPAASVAPAEIAAPAQSENSTPAENVKGPDKQSQTVYYTKTGGKYHYENPCGKGTYYPCTLDEAIAKGLTPCEKCVN